MTRRRLDGELVRRGLASTREEARQAILAGKVVVDAQPATKPSRLVAPSEDVAMAAPSRRFVSRGGDKLAAALDRLGVDPRGRRCLDVGASTGGFTDAMLSRGAAHVVALDVGYGQLAWSLRTDPRVTVMERANVRSVGREDLPYAADLVTADLSFISLASVVPTLVDVSAPTAELLLLVKPQFEAGRQDVRRGGVVADPEAWRRSVVAVADSCEGSGAGPQAVVASPLRGPAGNVEFFVLARRGATPCRLDIDAAIAGAPPASRTG
ncbi:MAG: TlyA family RNA methyltransferase [Actinomycetota bacterium]|nr:TlyA family RNA methyltransferase [Actinomycetota bacterium]